MNFLSLQFFIFIATTFALFACAHPRHRALLLLVASYIFYAHWSIPFIAVLVGTTSIDYFCSLIISKSRSNLQKKVTLLAGIGVNLSVLLFFKYFNFFIDSTNALRHLAGIPGQSDHLAILLPLGISFYTFEAISYLVDVYRGGRIAPSWFAYNFYIMWFPHLIAGPIVRFHRFREQYSTTMEFPSSEKIARAARLILLGYFCKSVVAGFASLLANKLWTNVHSVSTLQTQIAVMAFAIEIYYDFYGYTSIARGVSLLFNLELPQNFRTPGSSRNIADFWRRWNITLSLWLHDYLYVPMGGTRRSLPRTMMNVLIVFFIAGLWHGASWNFALMGIYFGMIVAIYHLYRRIRPLLLGDNEVAIINSSIYRSLSVFLTMTAVCIGGIFFRSESCSQAFTVIGNLIRIDAAGSEINQCLQTGETTLLFSVLFCLGAYFMERTGRLAYGQISARLPLWVKAQAATLVVILCWMCSADLPQQFWYARF